MGFFNLFNMKNNTIDEIKIKESEAEEKIKDSKTQIESGIVKKKESWQSKETTLLKEYEEKIKNLSNTLLNEKKEIDSTLDKKYKEKKEDVIKKVEQNLDNFKQEVFKRL